VSPAYWAFDIRHALNSRLYKNQAFSLGLFSMVLIIAILPSPDPGSGGILGSDAFLLAYFLITAVFWLGVINFVDATALVSRRLDPLLRDTMHWSKVRYLFWIIQGFIVSYTILAVTFAIAAKNTTLINEILQGNNNNLLSAAGIPVAMAWVLSFASLLVLVPVALRAKDPTLRRHLKWLAIFASVTLVLLLVSGAIGGFASSSSSSGIGDLVGNLIFMGIAAFCLYRSAKALVPLNKISR
jgi:magnesium-transporting ATPase (P-type)